MSSLRLLYEAYKNIPQVAMAHPAAKMTSVPAGQFSLLTMLAKTTEPNQTAKNTPKICTYAMATTPFVFVSFVQRFAPRPIV
jgi:hypothetical protein